MSLQFKYMIVPVLSIMAMASCTEDPAGGPVTETGTMDVVSAVYNDADGSYSVSLGGADQTVEFTLSSQREGLLSEAPVPMTGSYRMSSSEEEYAVEPGAMWIWEDGEHAAVEATVYVIASDGSCRLNGELTDAEGNVMGFSCDNVSFSHSITTPVVADAAYGEFRDGAYTMYLKSGDFYLQTTLGADPADGTLQAGTYELTDAVAVVAGTGYPVEGVLSVDRAAGGYVLGAYGSYGEGDMTFEYRGTYAGAIFSPEMMYPDLYTVLAGDWVMTSDRQYVYDSASKTWGYSDEAYEDAFTAVGVPNYHYMLMSGLFDDSFSFLTGVDIAAENSLFIPCSYETNPVARVSSGASSYYLFVTLFDPATKGFILSEAPIVLSADYSSMSISGVYAEVDGEERKYEYLGLIGANISTGQYTMFSNWPFVYLPSFKRPDASGGETVTPAPVRLKGNIEVHQIDEFVPAESITEIIPIKR